MLATDLRPLPDPMPLTDGSLPTQSDLAVSDTKLIIGPARPAEKFVQPERLPFDVLLKRSIVELGQSIGRYRIDQYISLRDNHHLYKASHPTLEFPVVLKVVAQRDPVIRAALVEQLRNEARILSSLSHWNVPRVWDFLDDPNEPVLVLEYIADQSLAQLLEIQKTLPPRKVLRIAGEINDALEFLARVNIVHRDVKPENIMLLPNGQAKLIDYGLALERGVDNRPDPDAPPIEYLGTPEYMSREQAINHGMVDHRADIYSLGVVIYRCLTGAVPFSHPNPKRVLIRQIKEKPASPQLYNRDLPDDLTAFILRLLSKNPADRMADHGMLRAELGALATATGLRQTLVTLSHF
jgi:serine/threonine protein kinase